MTSYPLQTITDYKSFRKYKAQLKYKYNKAHFS